MKLLANFIMKGRAQAVMVATFMALLSLKFAPVSLLSSASVALVTLRQGALSGVVLILLASVASALLGALIFGSFQFTLTYVLFLWFPVWAIALILREGRRLSLTVEIAVGLGLLGVAAFYLFHPDPAAFWNELLMRMYEPLHEMLAVAGDELKQTIARLSKLMTGVVALGIILSLLFGLFLGRWWQSLLFNPGGFREEFLAIRTHSQVAVVAAVCIAAALALPDSTLKEVNINFVVLFFALYSIVGTAALHAAFARLNNSRFMVPFLYMTLLLIPHVAIAVAIFGLGDTWFKLRDRFSDQTGA